MIIEDIRDDIQLLVEGRDPIIKKQDQHEQKIIHHETRLTTLEDYTYTKDRLK